MFEVKYHPDAESEANDLPVLIRVKYDKLVQKLEAYQQSKTIFILRVFVKKSQKTPPGEIELALSRLEEIKNDI
ncbi:TPA: hypothetical protein MB364_000822 [Klebsiella variicola subsp. variicola]|nr:hypothetical protein [Klebsiella variicola subsp. variicola]